MERSNEIFKLSEELIKDRFSIRSDQLKLFINENLSSILTGFIKTFDALFKKANELQQKKIKNNISIINISFLYSNLLINKYGFQIDLYDNEYYLDQIEISADLDLSFLFGFVEEDMEYIRKKLSKKFIKLKYFEVLKIKNRYIMNYYMIAQELIKSLTPYIKRMKEYKKLKKADKVVVFLGEYMGMNYCIQEFKKEVLDK